MWGGGRFFYFAFFTWKHYNFEPFTLLRCRCPCHCVILAVLSDRDVRWMGCLDELPPVTLQQVCSTSRSIWKRLSLRVTSASSQPEGKQTALQGRCFCACFVGFVQVYVCPEKEGHDAGKHYLLVSPLLLCSYSRKARVLVSLAGKYRFKNPE